MNILDVVDLKKHYPIHAGLLRREIGRVRAVDGVSFHIAKGETLALVGESGCGKTVLLKLLISLLQASTGKVLFDGQDSIRIPKLYK